MIVTTVERIVDVEKVSLIRNMIKQSGLKVDIKTKKLNDSDKVLISISIDRIFSSKLDDVIAYILNQKK